jgi:hypothetical protein
MEILMFTAKLVAGALALALLAITPSSPASAAPAVAPEPATASGSKASGITLVRQGGGRGFSSGGGNRGFSSGGNRGFSSRGFSSGGNRGFSSGGRSRGFASRGGGSNRAMRFNGGGSRKFSRGYGVARKGFNINPRYDRRRHAKHRHHRRFPGYAIYGAVPYVYDYGGYGCEDLYDRAIATNSAYWWNLYYDCRDGD